MEVFFIGNSEWDRYTEILMEIQLRGEKTSDDDILMAVSRTESHHVWGIAHLRISKGGAIARIASIHWHGRIERRPCNYNFHSLLIWRKMRFLSLFQVKVRVITISKRSDGSIGKWDCTLEGDHSIGHRWEGTTVRWRKKTDLTTFTTANNWD